VASNNQSADRDRRRTGKNADDPRPGPGLPCSVVVVARPASSYRAPRHRHAPRYEGPKGASCSFSLPSRRALDPNNFLNYPRFGIARSQESNSGPPRYLLVRVPLQYPAYAPAGTGCRVAVGAAGRRAVSLASLRACGSGRWTAQDREGRPRNADPWRPAVVGRELQPEASAPARAFLPKSSVILTKTPCLDESSPCGPQNRLSPRLTL